MDKHRLKELAANKNHIKGISRYCDRWCERCSFTSRCLLYAMEKDEPISGDMEAKDMQNEKFWKSISDNFKLVREMLKEDAKKFDIDIDALPEDPELNKMMEERHEFAHNHPLSKKANHYLMTVHKWLNESKDLFDRKADEIQHKILIELKNEDPRKDVALIEDSVDIISWYFMQINVKLVRAFSSRYMDEAEGWDDEDEPKDSDGSAKVSLIGIDRSIAAWSILLNQFPEQENTILDMLVQLEVLRKGIEKEFPDARSFKRPGFDDAVS